MWENEKYGRHVIRSLPRISIVPHLEVLDSHNWGRHGKIEERHVALAWVFALKLACRLQRVADVVEVIKVSFHQNVNLPNREIIMQVSITVSPPNTEKKETVYEHVCLVSLEENQEVDIDIHIGGLKKKLECVCKEKQIQFQDSINKLAELMYLLTDTSKE